MILNGLVDAVRVRHVARGGSGGSDKPPSQIKGPLFYKKVHYLQTKGSLLLYK